MNFTLNFADNTRLVYYLIEHDIVDKWAQLIGQRTVSDLCPINHYIGYSNQPVIQQRIDRLYELADLINSASPSRVVKQDLGSENWRHGLNSMHVHFPELKNDDNFKHLWPALSEYNDTIHWLESVLSTRGQIDDNSRFGITLDFNKAPDSVLLDIPDDAYRLFDPWYGFGKLQLHYVHVGRHARELFVANDMVCPSDQFVPQHKFGASARLTFYDIVNVDESLKEHYRNLWRQFYESRGGMDYWQMPIDDPRMAFGYITIGQLIEVNIDDVVQELSTLDIKEFRERLSKTSVVDWTIN